MKMPRTRLVGFLLWLVLAFAMAQQASLLHGLGHAVDRTAGAPCGDCAVLANLSGPLSAAVPAIPVVEGLVQASPPALTSAPARLALAFHSRAPPTVL